VAFKVTSGVDSRTILDMIGAEKLLGKGDMLFYPQGYTKPLRVQGAFVSDKEVGNVVEFLKKNAGTEVYDPSVESEIAGLSGEGNAENTAKNSSDNSFDAYFDDACRFVVEKEKASSGMLQRVFKVGYTRAARIVDQMEAVGVVGPEEGTKPRRVLMDSSQLENFLRNKNS
ncbi:MAG TPA: DNA translocase FtsK, partial [Lachnospiraceae bacterium]|nr:DNA translocase FtsK [Lachnospiraceae bacterium]